MLCSRLLAYRGLYERTGKREYLDDRLHICRKGLGEAAGVEVARAGTCSTCAPMSCSATTTRRRSAGFSRASALRGFCTRSVPSSRSTTPYLRRTPSTPRISRNPRVGAPAGIEHFFEVGRGICHQVISEEALVLPARRSSARTATRPISAGSARSAWASGALRWRPSGRPANCAARAGSHADHVEWQIVAGRDRQRCHA